MLKQDKKQWFRPMLSIIYRDYSHDNANNVLKTCKSGSGTVSIMIDYGRCVYPYGMLCESCDNLSPS